MRTPGCDSLAYGVGRYRICNNSAAIIDRHTEISREAYFCVCF